MKRTLVIGDIHGALKALEQLLERIDLQPEDHLIFLGDYVDGWSQSAGVIDYLMALDREYCCIFIRGNHDAWCEDWLSGQPGSDIWLFNGGQSTVKSYLRLTDEQRQEHLAFFNRMHNYYVDEENRLFIHAGFSSMHGPDHEHYKSNYSWDRTLWEMALAMDRRIEKDSWLYPRRLLLYREIYIGHTPTLRYGMTMPMQACNVWNLDTGAAFTGRISAMAIDGYAVWQSDVVQQLYPQEKGRNK
ncbi:metallophosphoesterase family protein [Taibaiella koreensis]|uniref:metallophosphoesterase family protein n=1 Tax=Taibaiella koreensis TaxID=1268548 RepID=UPI000E59F601|nr:metallophosphoesterase family protein [Taibaiella koreensis]